MSEPRTTRDARLAVRSAEEAVELVHMSPAMASSPNAEFYLRKARLALRQAERWLAKADDPRLTPLAPLKPQLRERSQSLRRPRRRHRCANCFHEELLNVAFSADMDPEVSKRLLAAERKCPKCGGEMEPVKPLRRSSR